MRSDYFAGMLHAVETDPHSSPEDVRELVDAAVAPDDTPTELEIPER